MSMFGRAGAGAPPRRTGIGAVRVLVAVTALCLAPLPATAITGGQNAVVGDPAGCAAYVGLQEPLTLTPGGTLTLPPTPQSWTMPQNPTWRENPFSNKSWRIRYHSLRYVDHLFAAWCDGGPQSLLDRAEFLLRDWYNDNPIGAAAPLAWYDHPVAWRSITYTRAARILPETTWLRGAIRVHGEFLAVNYGGSGNHALNENRGLLAAGCYLDRSDWKDLAVSRMTSLLRVSIDAAGVTNEQAVGYQEYNYLIYRQARAELVACGLTPPPVFSRIDLMPGMLAHATLPNGEYEMLGDTPRKRALRIDGTWTEFTATQGVEGSPPPSTVAIYTRGFAFARTGWGESRDYEDEIMMSLRFGPGRAYHGHDDGGSITLYGYGSRLLLDPGKNTWHNKTGVWPVYFYSRPAHNVVTVDGLTYYRRTSTSMTSSVGARHAFFSTGNAGYSGVTNRRTVFFSRLGGYAIVDDRLSSSLSRTYRQLWHLREDADPVVSGSTVRTRSPQGNLLIRQLITGHTTKIVTGRTTPRQGWLTYEYQKAIPAPVVEQIKKGTSARFLTLLVPTEGASTVSVSVIARYSDGYQVEVTIDGRTERVTVRGGTVTVTTVTGGGGTGPTPLSEPWSGWAVRV